MHIINIMQTEQISGWGYAVRWGKGKRLEVIEAFYIIVEVVTTVHIYQNKTGEF